MITVFNEVTKYPESVEECNELKCIECIVNIYNMESEEDCFHRILLTRLD